MIATFWFLIQSLCIVIAVTWLISLGGEAAFNVSDYTISMPFGMFVICMGVAIWGLSIIGRLILAVIFSPQTLLGHNALTEQKKGVQALACGLSAVASGDVRMAQYYSNRTMRFLKDDFGLAHLLAGLTARLLGHDNDAHQSFLNMMDQTETSALGAKALLQTALNKGDYRYARMILTRSYEKNPKNIWVIEQLYHLELRCGQYASALDLLDQWSKVGGPSKKDSAPDRAIIMMQMNDMAKAYKTNKNALAIGLKTIPLWIKNGKKRKAINAIKNLWSITPHPKLIDFWIQCAPKKALTKPILMVAWIEDLQILNKNSASSALYSGQALLRIGQKEHANRFIKNAMTLKPTIQTARLMNQMDPMGGWMDNIELLKQDKTWVCTQTGKIQSSWKPLTTDGHFNTITWMYPMDNYPTSSTTQQSIGLL